MLFNLKVLASTLLSTVVFAVAVGSAEHLEKRAQLTGIDVSSWQGNVDWSTVKGIAFSYIKATEGTGYTNPDFPSQYNGAANAHLIRGAYHFALPDVSTGADQADYFISNGGGWVGDGHTLPGAISIAWNPYGSDQCFGLSTDSMVRWINDFSSTYYDSAAYYPVIYTSTDWWNTCTGNYAGRGSTNLLWIKSWSSSVGTLPAGWSYYTFWQNAESGSLPGSQDRYNGDMNGLLNVANNDN